MDNIFLLSLPLMGEDLSQTINQTTTKYSAAIKTNKKRIHNSIALARHYFFSADLDELFRQRGFQFLTDGTHLNTTGAELASNAIKLVAMREKDQKTRLHTGTFS